MSALNRKILLVACVVGFMGYAPPPFAHCETGDSPAFVEAERLLEGGRCKEAVPLVEKAARAGDKSALVVLGLMYYEGNGGK
jgi:TPR repeat protein